MNIVKGYSCRFLKLWVFWFWAPGLDVLGLIIDTFVPSFSPPRWLYWAILAFGFVVGNVKLFAEQESEKQELQDHINEFEDARADIHFTKTEDFLYPASLHSPYFSCEGKTFHQTSDHLHKNGLPIGLVIGVELKGWKWSEEPGDLIWKITKVDLPPLFNLLESDKGSFQHTRTGGVRFDRIKDFHYEFEARYELPVEITEQDPRLFAQGLNSVGSYRVVIQYHTKRVDDSESKSHRLILEGDFEKFRYEICKKWKNSRFDELVQLAKCQ